jgi:phosphate starvation-inducible PhoH-like protein
MAKLKRSALKKQQLLTPTTPEHPREKMNIKFKNEEQEKAFRVIENNTITFLLGPAGTGKTHLALGYAIREFLYGTYEKIVITKPLVDAGEKLGFLPGEIESKIEPYMCSVLDVMSFFLDVRVINTMFVEQKFEFCPLAYMRGRTLKNAIIILDEAQNATKLQTEMFLTRIGEKSKIVCNGDFGQSDLNGKCRLRQISERLSQINGIGSFELKETVRHPLIAKIVDAISTID